MDRATLQGLLARSSGRAELVLRQTVAEGLGEAFRGEVLPRSVVYLRLGALDEANVAAGTDFLRKQAGGKTAAVILDLRATRKGDSYEMTAQVIGWFAARGTPFFHLRSPDAAGGKVFSGAGDPVFAGMLAVLINADCSGPAETVAACLAGRNRALLVGSPTTGRAWEFQVVEIAPGVDLRVAGARIEPLGGGPDPAVSLRPAIAVDVTLEKDREVLAAAAKDGIARYIFEVERPHMNEASLVAGRNPEIDQYQARQARGNAPEAVPLVDRTLQRALDILTTVLVYEEPKPGR